MKTVLIVLGVGVAGFVGYKLLVKPATVVPPVKSKAPPNKGGTLQSIGQTLSDFGTVASGLGKVTDSVQNLISDFS